MERNLDYIINQIGIKNPMHYKKLKKDLKLCDADFFNRAEIFLNRYKALLEDDKKDLDYAIDCYLKLLADVKIETDKFIVTGEYSSKSFEEVNKRVYDNPEIMDYYMHGLLLAQFLWIQNYKMFLFFIDLLYSRTTPIKSYLEIGGGHGLYISEAIDILGIRNTQYDFVDISQSSIDLAKKMIKNEAVNYIHSDIFEYNPDIKYDFITMGEVLEHVEEPIKLLKKISSLLNNNGRILITTPANAPMIDHIYLFKNVADIRNILEGAGFNIDDELYAYAEDVTTDIAERFKIPLRYAGCLSKKVH
jgi:2-polyprenyl-3-methyl-5-hydroxy-6-metoxy-1,4-benzoquinol methylase